MEVMLGISKLKLTTFASMDMVNRSHQPECFGVSLPGSLISITPGVYGGVPGAAGPRYPGPSFTLGYYILMSMVLVHQQFLELTREEGYPPRNLVLGNQLLSMNGFNYIIIMIQKYLPPDEIGTLLESKTMVT